jgi:hypothetical protein
MAHDLDEAGVRVAEFVFGVEAPFDGIIAACTELPIALDHSALPHHIPVVSSNQVLAHALVDTYYATQADHRIRASHYRAFATKGDPNDR